MLNDTNSLFIFIINFNSLDLPACLVVFGCFSPAWCEQNCANLFGNFSFTKVILAHNQAGKRFMALTPLVFPPHWEFSPSLTPWVSSPVHNPFQWLFSQVIFSLEKPHQSVVSQAVSCSFETRTEIKQLFPSYADNCWCFQRHLGGFINFLWCFFPSSLSLQWSHTQISDFCLLLFQRFTECQHGLGRKEH